MEENYYIPALVNEIGKLNLVCQFYRYTLCYFNKTVGEQRLVCAQLNSFVLARDIVDSYLGRTLVTILIKSPQNLRKER